MKCFCEKLAQVPVKSVLLLMGIAGRMRQGHSKQRKLGRHIDIDSDTGVDVAVDV